MPETELTKLRRARARAHKGLKLAEAQVAVYQAKIMDVEARIQAIAPELDLPPRHRQPNRIFARGEIPRLALDILRREGGPLSVAVIAVRALARKGIKLPGPGTRKETRKLLRTALAAYGRKGIVRTVGTGNETRRELVR